MNTSPSSRRRNREIPLSRKFGLNPTVPVCYWCGKEKNEVALLGPFYRNAAGEELEAPSRMVVDDIPCDDCKAKLDSGEFVAWEAQDGCRGLIKRERLEKALVGMTLAKTQKRVMFEVCPAHGQEGRK